MWIYLTADDDNTPAGLGDLTTVILRDLLLGKS